MSPVGINIHIGTIRIARIFSKSLVTNQRIHSRLTLLQCYTEPQRNLLSTRRPVRFTVVIPTVISTKNSRQGPWNSHGIPLGNNIRRILETTVDYVPSNIILESKPNAIIISSFDIKYESYKSKMNRIIGISRSPFRPNLANAFALLISLL